jgi:hypothetical protein
MGSPQRRLDQPDNSSCLGAAAQAEFLGRYSPIFSKFLIKNPAKILLAPLSGILPLACMLTDLAGYS